MRVTADTEDCLKIEPLGHEHFLLPEFLSFPHALNSLENVTEQSSPW